MAVKEFKVGPRSRVLEAKEAASRDLGDRVLGGLLPQETLDAVLYPPTSGPSNPTSLRSCGCGKQHIPHSDDPNEAVEVEGTVHRYSRPCYRVGDDGQRVYFDFKTYRTLESRVSDLERVVADLVARAGK
jgi:hypothetical protein